MSKEQYQKFQQFQAAMWTFVDSKFPADEKFGNELFQQMTNTGFEVFLKYDQPKPAPEMKVGAA